MDRRIGSFFLFVLWSCQLGAVAATLQVFDRSGAPVDQAVVHDQLILEVSVDTDMPVSNVTIPGIEQCEAVYSGRSMQKNSINGVLSAKTTLRYTIIPHSEGRLSLGPAELVVGSETVISNACLVTIVRDLPEHTKKKRPFLSVHVDKDCFFIGERVPFVWRFYSPRSDIQLADIKLPPMRGIVFDMSNSPLTKTERIDGVPYHCVECSGFIEASEAGTYTISRACAVFQVPRRHTGSTLDDFALMFGGRSFARVEQVVAEPVSFDVKSVPSGCSAVGHFSGMQLEADRNTITSGDAVMLKLRLQGTGNWNRIAAPRLSLPKGCTYYESHHSVDIADTLTGRGEKVFSYVVQCDNGVSGPIGIPAQSISFFDSHEQCTRTITSNELTLTVEPARAHSAPLAVEAGHTNTVVGAESTLPLCGSDRWYPTHNAWIAWLWFICMLCIPLIVFFVWYALLCFKRHRAQHSTYYQARCAANIALRDMKRAATASQVYTTMITFFAHHFSMNTAFVSEQTIERIVHGHTDHETAARWKVFFHELTKAAYTSTLSTQEGVDALKQKGRMWITLLRRYR